MYPYGIIGNCNGNALVSQRGAVDWMCLPRPDSPPLFGRLLDESCWHGYCKSAPVRSGNQAAEHVQNDVYGELLLTLTPLYFDRRFSHLRSERFSRALKQLAQQCYASLGMADAGLWELRDGWKVHNFSTLMSWAGLERFERLVQQGFLDFDLNQARSMTAAAMSRLNAASRGGILWNAESQEVVDASLVLAASLRFPNRKLVEDTIDRVCAELVYVPEAGEKPKSSGRFFFRYRYTDDFGKPKHPFLMCSFWIAEALHRIGRKREALEIFSAGVGASNHLGLLSEHFDPGEAVQLGNFPQCYSHLGLIHAAFVLSPSWDEIL